jgi:hypothetical protein
VRIRSLSALAAAIMLVAVAAAFAQSTPDFSGSWIRDEARSASTTAGRSTATPGASVPLGVTVIRQTATTLTIENELMGMAMTYVYKLDGSDSVNHNGAMVQTTRSHWSGATLVTEGKDTQSTSQGYQAWTLKTTRARDAKGNLIVDTTSTDSQGVVTTTHQVFTKATKKE